MPGIRWSANEVRDRMTIKTYGMGAEITAERNNQKSATWTLALGNGQTFEIRVTETTK
jgi:hypothetical protein